MAYTAVKIAIVGFGGVGKAVLDLAAERRERYRRMYNADVRVVSVCGSRAGIHDPKGLENAETAAERMISGMTGPDFLSSFEANVLVDATPTNFRTGGGGYTYVKRGLEEGRHVISISKGALVFDFQGLQELANRNGVTLKVSGATAAALPTIDLIEYNLRGCEVFEIEGILTATANYVLTLMTDRGLTVEEAAAHARAAGIAEKDPTFDIGGWDTACKITILANAGLGSNLSIEDVEVAGLSDITLEQMRAWKKEGVVPKLVGSLAKRDGKMKASVGLKLYPEVHAFAQVTGKSKAIRVVTDAMGELVVVGGGPEPRATAAAALKDLEHILPYICRGDATEPMQRTQETRL